MAQMAAVDETMTADEYVGAQVHQLMFRRRVSQTALAPQLGITQSVLSQKLRGKVTWSVRDLIAVAAALDTSAAALLPQMDSNHQPSVYQDESELETGATLAEVISLDSRRPSFEGDAA